MPRINWRTNPVSVDDIKGGIWYRSPLWDDDHLLGASAHFRDEMLAWCGRPLAAAAEYGEQDGLLGGLYESDRKTGKCSQCSTREQEWAAQ